MLPIMLSEWSCDPERPPRDIAPTPAGEDGEEAPDEPTPPHDSEPPPTLRLPRPGAERAPTGSVKPS
jgi:hypothetical protein